MIKHAKTTDGMEDNYTMKIALISIPTPTFNNHGAASALPYHLIKGAGDKARFEVWTYNVNHISPAEVDETERALGVKIHVLHQPWWMTWMFRLHMAVLRMLLRYPYLHYLRLDDEARAEIRAFAPDKLWIYGEETAHLARLFPDIPCVVTMPDCESLHYHRLLGKDFATRSLSQIMRYAWAFWQYRCMERDMRHSHALFHFVGRQDAAFFREVCTEANAVFLHHPLYAHRDKTIRFHQPKVRLLFAGRYDFYCRHGSDRLLEAMLAAADLKSAFEVTFLGKGWEAWADRLCKAGWTCHHIAFAPNYIEELQRHDIQVNAIDVGTGTKGKVLDAIANGLLEMGSPYALENIDVTDGDSCVLFHDADEAVAKLRDIHADVARYEAMAVKGRDAVLRAHDAAGCARELFGFE